MPAQICEFQTTRKHQQSCYQISSGNSIYVIIIYKKNIKMFVFYHYFSKVAFPSDFPRRSRLFDQATYKCHEFRQISTVLFPIFVRCLEPEKVAEKSLLLAFSFISRACRLPEEEYKCIPKKMLDDSMNIMAEAFDLAFGPASGTYNSHIVFAHMRHIREMQDEPFTEFCAYEFEGSYAEMKRCYSAGTRKFLHFN